MPPTVIVGAGIAGLTAALTLVRAGTPVRILDRAAPGGRARSRVHKDRILNLGPHALYRQGALAQWLRAQGIPVSGADPTRKPQQAWVDGRLQTLPTTPGALLTTPLLAGGRVAGLARLLRRPKGCGSVSEWLAPLPSRPRSLLEGFVRLSTYCPDLDALDAQAAWDQLQLSTRGVRYLDGGWQSLVDALLRALGEEGVRVEKASVHTVQAGAVHSDLGTLPASEVILALPPKAAGKLLGTAFQTHPVEVACLCLGLSERPDGPGFVLDLDAPRYAAVHSDSADLGAGAVLHLMHYAPGPERRAELEAWADQLYPGWRALAETQRYSPRLLACAGIPGAGRPRQSVRHAPGILLAGDWVGARGMLADAACASGQEAASLALQAHAGASLSQERG